MFKLPTYPLLLLIICGLSLTFCCNAQSQPPTNQNKANNPDTSSVSIITKDKFALKGHYYAGNIHNGGVLLLHGCNANQSDYQVLAKLLNTAKLHVLSFDFRGYGESQNNQFSQPQLRKKAKNILAYQSALTSLSAYWKNDALSAFNWLRNKVDKTKQIAIVSVGCASRYAVTIAENMSINSLIMVTPIMDYSDKEHYKNLADKPTYFVSAIPQASSYETAKELFNWNGSTSSKMQLFKDNRVDHSLLKHQKGLIEDMVLWLSYNLR
jgi:esterase/lipase